MATVTDLATVAAATAAGYALVQFTSGSNGRKIAILKKRLTGENGQTERAHEAIGEDATSATTARTNCLASLNAERRHRYAGAPGLPSGATTGTWPDGAATVPVVDVN